MSVRSTSSCEIDVSDLGSTFDMLSPEDESAVPNPMVRNDEEPGMVTNPPESIQLKSEAGENIRPLISIDSFVPLVQLLPGHRLYDSVYHIDGPISLSDRERLYAYTKEVGEFTLSNNVKEGDGRVGTSAFLRLALLQNPDHPVFPSMHRLRIVNVDSSLDYLHLLLTPSLRTLEIEGIPQTYMASFFSFLNTAIHEIPDLSTLIIGPGNISQPTLDTCLGFRRLRRLELVGAVSDFDHNLVEKIGRLEELEVLVIDAQAAVYIPSDSTPQFELDFRKKEEEEKEWLAEPFRLKEIEGEVMCQTWLSAYDREVELVRRKREIDERQEELSRSLDTLGSSKYLAPKYIKNPKGKAVVRQMEDLRQQQHALLLEKELIIKQQREALTQEAYSLIEKETSVAHPADPPQANNQPTGTSTNTPPLGTSQPPDETRNEPPHKLFTNLTALDIRSTVSLMEDLLHRVSSNNMKRLSLDLRLVSLSSIPEVEQFTRVSATYVARWADSIAEVSILSNGSFLRPKLPSTNVEQLLQLSKLERLEISGWGMDSSIVNDILSYNGLPENRFSKLKILHLPDESQEHGVPLSHLRSIAETCPDLRSLQCKFENLEEVPRYATPAPNPLSHSLEVLSVGKADIQANLKLETMVQIARYIDLIFPNLIRIESRDESEQNAQPWRDVYQLVRLRQSTRSDEKNRSTAS